MHPIAHNSPKLALALVFCAATLTACDKQSTTTPKLEGTVAGAMQAMPDKPLFNAPIVKGHDVLPQPKASTNQPLPAAVALPSATAAITSTATASPEGGAVNPAAGMAAAVTDSQGAQHNANSN